MGFEKKTKTATAVVAIATITRVSGVLKVDLTILANCKAQERSDAQEHGNRLALTLFSPSAFAVYML